MSKWAFINNDFVAEPTANIHFRDLAIQRGYGIFDFFKLSGHTPVFLEKHLARFFASAEEMRLPVAKTKQELENILVDLIEKNRMPGSGIRLTLTGGYSSDGYQLAEPNLIISQQAFQPPSEEQFLKGIKLVSYEHRRQLPQVKSIDYLMAIWLQPFIKEQGADDVLYHTNGHITECPRSNFFMVTQEETIVTPKEHILKGIIRNSLLEIAGDHFRIEEREVSLSELETAREAFISSTTKNLLPVHSVNGKSIGTGSAGSITKELSRLLQTHLQQYTSSYK